MFKAFSIVLLAAATVQAGGLPSEDEQFLEWAMKNGKQYKTSEEMAMRKTNWKKANARIARLAREHPNLQFKHNAFSANTDEEWKSMLGGAAQPEGEEQ